MCPCTSVSRSVWTHILKNINKWSLSLSLSVCGDRCHGDQLAKIGFVKIDCGDQDWWWFGLFVGLWVLVALGFVFWLCPFSFGGGGPIVPYGFQWGGPIIVDGFFLSWLLVFLPLVVVGIWLNLVRFVLSCVLCYRVEDAWLCGDGCWLVATSLSTVGLCFFFFSLIRIF